MGFDKIKRFSEDAEDLPTPPTSKHLYAPFNLAKASARIRFGSKVTVEDAEKTIRLMELAWQQVGIY